MILSKRDKNYYRSLFRENRLNIADKAQKDLKITKSVLDLDEVKSADKVLVYISAKHEIDTFGIIDSLRKMGKQIAAPVCVGKQMSFYIFDSEDKLKKGSFGISEPDVKVCKRLDDYRNSVCIVPMLGFDISGYRMGYGGGFYDRFLKEFSGVSVGLSYSINRVDRLPGEKHDIPLGIIITEDNIYRFCQKGNHYV